MPIIQGPGTVLANQIRMEVDMRVEIGKQAQLLPSFIDVRLGMDQETIESIQSVAELAHRCVALKGSDRPSMQEVVIELRQIQSRNLGQPYVEGHNDLPNLQETHGVISFNEDKYGASFPDYTRIPLDQRSSFT